MKVELQSASSDSGEFVRPGSHSRHPSYDPRRRLWRGQRPESSARVPGPVPPSRRRESFQSDDDFEFVITRSKTAKKVKRSSFDANDNYRRVDDRSRSRHMPNGYHSRDHTPMVHRDRRHREKKPYQPRGHPGLEPRIDFDPFESTSEDTYEEHDDYDSDGYRPRRRGTQEFEEFPPVVEPRPVDYPPPSVVQYQRSCNLLVTIKTFFRTVGFKIKSCFNRSKTYLTRMVNNGRNRRRMKKLRDPLLPNQQSLTDIEREPETERESTPVRQRNSGTVYRQKLNVPFNLNSNSTSSFEDLDAVKTKKSKLRFPMFKRRESQWSNYRNPKKSLKHVRLHSFPDG